VIRFGGLGLFCSLAIVVDFITKGCIVFFSDILLVSCLFFIFSLLYFFLKKFIDGEFLERANRIYKRFSLILYIT